MDSRKVIIKEAAVFSGCIAAAVALMVGIFAIIGKFDLSVLLGGAAGGLIAILYYLSIVIFAYMASKKAQNQDVQGGQKLMQMSYTLRMLLVFGALLLCAISGFFNVLSLAIPMLFVRPAIAVANAILKKGGSNT